MRRFIALTVALVLGGCGGSPHVFAPSASLAPSGARVQGPLAREQGPCVYLLRTGESSDFSHMHLSAPNCFIYISDTANMSYSTIKAAKILYAGAPPNEMGARFPESKPAPGPVVSDPCPTIASCAYLMKHPPLTIGCPNGNFDGNGYTIGGAGTVTCFSNLSIAGNDITVCGLIKITGSQLHLNNASIQSCSSGVTFALSSNANDLNFSTAALTLSPPSSGKYKGMLFYRVASQSRGVDFSTCLCDFGGVVYFPTAAVNYGSRGGKYQLLIFGQVNFSNNGDLRFGNPP